MSKSLKQKLANHRVLCFFCLALIFSTIGCEKDSFEKIDVDIEALENNSSSSLDLDRLESEIHYV